MKVKVVKSEGLAHNSYFLSEGVEAVVVDPRRDCEVYMELAKRECVSITYILETHRNEDYVAGSVELQNMSEAEICHSGELQFGYGEHRLSDGDTLTLGASRIKVLYTPGHTDESLCYALYPAGSSEPSMVFSGDTLFAGSVGRTDLQGKAAQPSQAEKLYTSLHEKLLMLGDGALVYPAHGAGSVCGHGITGQEPTTIGWEKKNNPYLQLNKEGFLQKTALEELILPRYFRKMEKLNQNGPPLLSELAYPKPFSLRGFEELAEPLVLAVDTRMHYAFAGSHIPGSLSLWLGGTSVYPGWFLDTNQYIVFVHERSYDIEKAARRFRRLGFDNLCGYLCGGMDQSAAGRKTHRSRRHHVG